MNSFYFIIPGKPKGKGRPRFAGGHVFTPQATHDYERLVAACARRALADREADGAEPWCPEAPMCVDIWAHFATPKSLSRKRAFIMSGEPCCKKPDADNIAKIILDGLNGIAFRDDSQVTEQRIRKDWRADLAGSEYPCGYVEVRISEAGRRP